MTLRERDKPRLLIVLRRLRCDQQVRLATVPESSGWRHNRPPLSREYQYCWAIPLGPRALAFRWTARIPIRYLTIARAYTLSHLTIHPSRPPWPLNMADSWFPPQTEATE